MLRINNSQGFTLSELMIAIAILGVTTAAAAPGMSNMLKSNRLSSAANDFIAAMQLAKSHSIAQIVPVSICAKNPANDTCANGGWENGWIVFSDVNNDGTLNTGIGDTLLLKHEALNSEITFRGSQNFVNSVTYRPTGNTSLNNTAILTLCDKRGFSNGRGILVTMTGSANVMEASKTGAAQCL